MTKEEVQGSFKGAGDVLFFTLGAGYTSLLVCENSLNCILMFIFLYCVLYFNKF